LDDGIVETAVAFPVRGETVRGVLCVPPGPARRAPGVVLIHGWAGCRAGPHRLFVDAARRCARAGLPSLRIDLRGRGESDGEGVDATLDGMIEDACAAADHLKAAAGVGAVAFLGICSGGNVAVGAATLRPDAAALALWSTFTFTDRGPKRRERAGRTWQMVRRYARKALDPSTWARLLRGEVNVRMAGRAIAGTKAGDAGAKDSARDIMDAFAAYTGRVLFLYGTRDPEGRTARRVYRDFCEARGLRAAFRAIEGANHNFYGEAWRAEVIETTAAWLAEEAP
jgi:pimeloyl-ACP methyl ester carboxylesterase